jgi:hypothetical protein
LYLSVLLAYADMDHSFFDRMFNSDSMYFPSLFQEFFIEGEGFGEFKLNGQPNFFPDMVIYFPIYALIRSIVWSGIIYSLVQVSIFIIIIFQLAKELLPQEKVKIASSLVVFIFTFIIGSAAFGKEWIIPFQILSNGFHTSAFILALLALLFYLKINEDTKKLISLLGLAVFIGTLNDGLFSVLFVIPFLITIFVSSFLIKKTKPLVLAGVVITASLFAQAIYRAIGECTSWSFIKQGYSLSVPMWKKSAAVFFEMWSSHLFSFNFNTFISIVGLSAIGQSLFCIRKRYLLKMNLFFVAFVIATVFTPLLLGTLDNPFKLRYSVFVFYFAPIILCINSTHIFSMRYIERYAITLSLVLAVVLGLMVGKLDKNVVMSRATEYQPQRVKDIDLLCDKVPGLKNGVSTYWSAKQTTYFSSSGVKIYAIYYPELKPNLYTGHNKWWYYGKDDGLEQEFNFVVMNKPEDTLLLKKEYPQIDFDVYNEGGTYLVIMPTFKFGKGIDGPIFSN